MCDHSVALLKTSVQFSVDISQCGVIVMCYFLDQQTFHSQSCQRVIRVTPPLLSFSGRGDQALIGLSVFQGSGRILSGRSAGVELEAKKKGGF